MTAGPRDPTPRHRRSPSAPPRPAARAAPRLLTGGRGGRGDQVFRGVALAAGPAGARRSSALIAWSTTKEAWPAFQAAGPQLRHLRRLDARRRTSSGRSPSSTAPCCRRSSPCVIAVPVSLGIALFTNEAAPRRLRKPVVYVMDLLAAMPVGRLRPVGRPRARPEHPARLPVDRRCHRRHPGARRHLRRRGQRQSFMTAGIILAIMITPDRHLAQPRGHRHRARAPSARRPTAWAPPAGR